MIAVLLSFAVAGLPEGVDPEDLDRWEALSRRASAGPEGCWRFEGNLKITSTLQQKARLFRRAMDVPMEREGTFVGELVDGTWRLFDYDLASGTSGVNIEGGVQPVFGIMPEAVSKNLARAPEPAEPDGEEEGNASEGVNLLRRAMDVWKASTGVSYAQWREDLGAIELVEQVPTEEKGRDVVTKTTLFPGGAAVPSRMSVMLPKGLVLGSWPMRVHVYDAQAHLFQRPVEELVLPTAETMSAVVSVLGFTVGYEQRIDYRTASRCTP